MDISAFHTQQVSAKAGKGGNATGQALQGGQGLFATGLAGVNFMDLIFARSTATTKAGNTETGNSENEQTPSLISLINKNELSTEEIAVLDETLAKLKESGALIESALENMDSQTEPLSSQQILKSILTDDPEIFAALDIKTKADDIKINVSNDVKAIKNAKELNAFLKNLLAGLPEDSRPVISDINTGEIKQVLQFDPEADAAGETLIATGLSVSDLTQLIEDISNGDEQGEALAIGYVKILPPNAKKDTVFTPRGMIIPQTAPKPDGEALAAKLNSLLAGTKSEAESTTLFNADGEISEDADFDSVLKVLERAQIKAAANGKEAPGLEKAIERIQKLSVGNSAVQLQGQTQAAQMSEIFAEFQIDEIFPEGFDFLQGSSASSGQGLNNALAQITSLITNVQQAGHPHPSSQAVAQVIAKASGQGENRNFTIQLDPPDLGKVQIRLEFAKDKAMKAHLVVEKPETHLMLQRDAQLLERTLQDMGIETDDGSLNFELSQDGNLFDHNQKDQGGNSGAGGGADDGAVEDEGLVIIETTMDWHVDPHTGHTSYNLLV